MGGPAAFGDPLVYVRAIHFAATIVAAGTVLFMFFVAEPAFRQGGDRMSAELGKLRRRYCVIVLASLGLAVLSGLVWLILLAANIYVVSASEVWHDGGIWTVIGQTRFGQVWSVRMVLAVLLPTALPSAATPLAGLRRGVVPAIVATGFLIAPAWVGHAGATPGDAGQFPLAADALHLLAAGAWLGGLPPLAILLAAAWRGKEPGWTAVAVTAAQRFSLLGVFSVGVLLASGIINSWYEVGSFGNLVATPYGWLVLAKFALFAAMIALAGVNRFYLTPRLAMAGAVQRLHHNTIAESVLGFAAIAVVGFLGVMAPASHGHNHPSYGYIPADAAYVHIHSLAGMADVTIVPGHAGTARALIRLWTEDFVPLPVQRLTLTLTPPAAGGKSLIRDAAAGQDGSWEVDAIELAQPGNWTVAVDAGLDSKRRLVLQAPIAIAPRE